MQHYDQSVYLTDRTFDAATLAATDVLRILRDGRPRTRVELAELLGVARATISLRVDPLITTGLVTSVADAQSTGGRRATRMSLNSGSRVVLAADAGSTRTKVAITDLHGVVLGSAKRSVSISESPDVVLGAVMELAAGVLKEIGRSLPDVVAIGLGLPCPIDHVTGRPSNPPAMPGWNDYDIEGWFQRRIDVPVVVDNDVNIMACGERAVTWPDVANFMFVKVSTGIGAAIISTGTLQRGAQNIAGHIGHIPVSRGAGIRCHCGNLGCITAVASGPAVLKALGESGVDVADGKDLVRLVRDGNGEAIDAVRQAGRDIGEVLVSATGFVNPSVIAVGGSLADAGEHFLAGIREVVYSRAMPLATENLSIVQSKTAGDAGVIGASLLAIERLFSPEGVSSILARTA